MIINDNNDVNLRPYYRFSLLIDNIRIRCGNNITFYLY